MHHLHHHCYYCYCSLEGRKVPCLWKLSKRKLHPFQSKFYFLSGITKYLKSYIEGLVAESSFRYLCFFSYKIIECL